MEKINLKVVSESLELNERRKIMGGCGGWLDTKETTDIKNVYNEVSH